MAKRKTSFVCQSCGAAHVRWAGQCDACGAWNTLAEETAQAAPPKGITKAGGRRIELVALDGAPEARPRHITGLGEFDRVCGGGLVPGSTLLLAGEPGIGKSTVMLQAAARLAKRGGRAVYITGEEAVEQVRERARRLGLAGAPVELASATNVRDMLASLDDAALDLLIIDSIQTMYVDVLDSAPGTVAQVRSAAQDLIRMAKRRRFALILVGHVTKEGMIAGPKVLEHMVDTVLNFEGERGHQFRILRAVKNRYGPTDEIGVFEMTDRGLAEVENPSRLFLGERDHPVSGAAVFAGMEGTRPVLVEFQALVSSASYGTPRRAIVGWDAARLAMVLAVLETRCGVNLAGNDIFLNVAGGLRIGEPAADLAAAAALVSAFADKPLPSDMALFGEVGLGGEVRPVAHAEQRIKEAYKLGFRRVVAPPRPGRGVVVRGLDLSGLRHLSEILALFDSEAGPLPATLGPGGGARRAAAAKDG